MGAKIRNAWVKVFRIIPEFRILSFEMLNSADYNGFSDLVSFYLKVFDGCTRKF